MRPGVLLQQAASSILRSAGRSALTALGVIIGVASVITMTGLGEGARTRVDAALSRPDSRLVTLGAEPHHGAATATADRSVLEPGDGLNLDDYHEIRATVSNIAAATALTFRSGEMVAVVPAGKIFTGAEAPTPEGRQVQSDIVGTDIDGFEMEARSVVEGTVFGEFDVVQARTVCVVTSSLARALFAGRGAEGQTVRLAGIPFLVIGVVSDRDGDARQSAPAEQDLRTFIPVTTFLRRLNTEAAISILMQSTDPSRIRQIQQRASDLMEERRGRRRADFFTYSSAEAIEAYAQGSRTMSRLLAAISLVSLVVGGVGIMNTMLISVAERKREIGIRIALGTRAADIQLQFALEALMLSLIGGLAGIAVGVGVSRELAILNGWSVPITLSVILIAVGGSTLTGLAFGYYPARRAAHLDPVEALKSTG